VKTRLAGTSDAGVLARMLHNFNTEFGEDDTGARALYESLGFRNEVEGESNSRSLFYEREL
jgi:hypothetical protein